MKHCFAIVVAIFFTMLFRIFLDELSVSLVLAVLIILSLWVSGLEIAKQIELWFDDND